jgi:putative tricarboxylic transport membrane protein
MRALDLVTAGVLMLLGGVVLFDAVRLGIGWGTDGPRSGFFPFWLAVIMLGCCALIFAQAWRAAADRPFATRAQLASVSRVLLPAVGLVVAMQWVGLYVASAVYMAVYMRWIGHHRWITVVAVSVGITVAIFLIFETWFLVPMPKGPLESWLGY